MDKNKFKILTILVLLLFIYSCIKSTTYVSPIENDKISKAKKIVVQLENGTELELKNVKVEMEKEKIVGYTKDEVKKEIDFSLIRAVIVVKENYEFVYLYGGVALVGAWLLIGAATAPEPHLLNHAHLSIPSMVKNIFLMLNLMEEQYAKS